MKTRALPCGITMPVVWKSWPIYFGLGMALAALVSPLTAGPAAAVGGTSEQAARDDERERILHAELQRTEALVAHLAERKADRLTAADAKGAEELEAQRVRALSDIAGLKREIALIRSSAAPQGRTRSPARVGTGLKPGQVPSTAPWWDVYGRGMRGDPPGVPSHPVGARDASDGSSGLEE